MKSLGGDGFLQLHIPQLSRVGVHAALRGPATPALGRAFA